MQAGRKGGVSVANLVASANLGFWRGNHHFAGSARHFLFAASSLGFSLTVG
jgi:hypothetical protein